MPFGETAVVRARREESAKVERRRCRDRTTSGTASPGTGREKPENEALPIGNCGNAGVWALWDPGSAWHWAITMEMIQP